MQLKRVMLKLSGEALADKENGGYNESKVKNIAKQILLSVNKGVDVGVVEEIIGGVEVQRI